MSDDDQFDTSVLNTSTILTQSHKIDTVLYLAQICANAGVESNNPGYADYVGNNKDIKAPDIKNAYILLKDAVIDSVAHDPSAMRAIESLLPNKSLTGNVKVPSAEQLYTFYLKIHTWFFENRKQMLEAVVFFPKPSHSKVISNCNRMFEYDRMAVMEEDMKQVKDTLANLASEFKISTLNENLQKISTDQQKLFKSQSEHSMALKSLDSKVIGEGKKTTDASVPVEGRSQQSYASTLQVPVPATNARSRSNSRASRRGLGNSPAPANKQVQSSRGRGQEERIPKFLRNRKSNG